MLQKIRRSKLGFTLIELFIVIVIIVILAMVAVPRFLEMRDNKEQQIEENIDLKDDDEKTGDKL
ncbi:MAG: prepilin-type N-terminal cleavage/methylation domain-containing protein [Gammaproteobacteria bacterium]|nr:prepilin-type N-terminal cleavage/methylation domain-containing protein [Gammaproteobacteria bacterium]